MRHSLQPEPPGHYDQVRKRVGLHLAHDLTSMRLHGDLADPELAGDLFVQQPRDDQCHDLAFTRRQRRIAVPQRSHIGVETEAARLRSMAPRIAFNSSSSLNGFVRNSTAPAFIAWTVIGTSPWPVMKMIGMSVRSASCCCSSRPLSPGSETSSTRQHGTVARGRARNSCGDANVSGFQPALLISSSSDSRTEMSSSTTKTVAVTSGMARAPILAAVMERFPVYPPRGTVSVNIVVILTYPRAALTASIKAVSVN